MTEQHPARDGSSPRFRLTGRYCGAQILLDRGTGMPIAFTTPDGTRVCMNVRAELASGGIEVETNMGGLAYADTSSHTDFSVIPGTLHHLTNGSEDTYSVETQSDEWRLRFTFHLRPESPCIEFRIAVTPLSAGAVDVRNLRILVELDEQLSQWQVETPGSPMRPGVRADQVGAPLPIFAVGHELGSPGLIALHRDEIPVTVVVWPFSRSEPSEITLQRIGESLQVRLDTLMAGHVTSGEWLEYGPVYMDVADQTWASVRTDLHRWYRRMGLQTPADRPAWVRAASIYEVMVGSAPFHDGYTYAPYPTHDDLIEDLDRVSALGFTCIQLMPLHPYPSYNIHRSGDVATTYGDPETIHRLVRACHKRELKIIVDVLLHGVLDHVSLQRALDVVIGGPHAARLGENVDAYTSEGIEISWARHIVAFAEDWRAGSPASHPLLEEHPEWFMRDSLGNVTGIYTQALDIANPEWQAEFIDNCRSILTTFGIDGFRFDAPLYNRFANWSDDTRRHASYSSLGAFELLNRMRTALRAVSPEVFLYSEPGGSLARESLDASYGYEERWVIESLFDDRFPVDDEWRRVRSGAELSAWFRDFDAAVPPGSITGHFVDCHDTIWWRLSGDHWRREQIGLGPTRALVTIYGLRGGIYMTCAGAEEGLESELQKMNRLRRSLPEIRDGEADFNSVSVGSEALYAVLRTNGDRSSVVVVNTTDRPVRSRVNIRGNAVTHDVPNRNVADVWNSERVELTSGDSDFVTADLSFEAFQTRVLVLNEFAGRMP